MDRERLQELAALRALGALEGTEAQEFDELLADGDAEAQREFAAFTDVMGWLAAAGTAESAPPPRLKEQLLHKVRAKARSAAALRLLRQLRLPVEGGFAFVRGTDPGPWLPLPVPGAFIRLLHLDETRGYAVLLGKLEAGSRYPAHVHLGAEQITVLSGDLHIGDKVLHAGDFHHAEAGTAHGVNFSEQGCTILAVVTTESLLQQLGRAD